MQDMPQRPPLYRVRCRCGFRFIPDGTPDEADLERQFWAHGWRVENGKYFCSEQCVQGTKRDVYREAELRRLEFFAAANEIWGPSFMFPLVRSINKPLREVESWQEGELEIPKREFRLMELWLAEFRKTGIRPDMTILGWAVRKLLTGLVGRR